MVTLRDLLLGRGPSAPLTVIFFAGASKTRAIELSRSNLQSIILGGLGLVSMTLLSWVLLLVLIFNANGESRRIHEVQEGLFALQTRYENVFEKTYNLDSIDANGELVAAKAPEEPSKVKPEPVPTQIAVKESSPVTSIGKDKNKVEKEIKPTPAKTLVTKSQVTKSQVTKGGDPAKRGLVATETVTQEAKQESTSSAVRIRATSFKKGTKSSTFFYTLVNTSQKSKARGKVWSVAVVENNKGERKFVGSPTRIGAIKDMKPKFPEKSNRFRMRKSWKSKFKYAHQGYRVVAIKVGVNDEKGQEIFSKSYQILENGKIRENRALTH